MANNTESAEIGQTANATDTDAQVRLMGTLKSNSRTDMVVFKLSFMILEMHFIVVIPAEGSVTAPVYVKFKIRPGHDKG